MAKYCFGFTSGMRPNGKAVTVESSKLSKINRAGQFKYFIFYRELSLGGKIDQNETTSPFVNLFRRRR